MEGMKRTDTRHGNPARYLRGTIAPEIQRIETTTVRGPDRDRNASAFKREYQRETGAVIGWDDGRDATISFVECSGGERAGRVLAGPSTAAR